MFAHDCCGMQSVQVGTTFKHGHLQQWRQEILPGLYHAMHKALGLLRWHPATHTLCQCHWQHGQPSRVLSDLTRAVHCVITFSATHGMNVLVYGILCSCCSKACSWQCYWLGNDARQCSLGWHHDGWSRWLACFHAVCGLACTVDVLL